jgi:hypothetical protein
MALVDFPIVPLTDKDDETVRVNKHAIIDVRIINAGKADGQEQNWFVQVTTVMGKYHLLRLEGAPYATKAAALTARDAFLETFN